MIEHYVGLFIKTFAAMLRFAANVRAATAVSSQL